MINVALLCGGSGTRLWPSSRASYPKQFAPLIGKNSLFQLSAQRFAQDGFGAPIAVTSEAFQSQKRFVVPYHGKRSDLGDWNAVWRDSVPDENGMVCGEASTSIACRNTLLRAEDSSQHVVGIGLENIIVVAMKDAVLVADKSRAQEVKQAVAAMRENAVTQADQLPRAYRPWGWYETLILGNRFQVKRIVVHPGAALSLQSHHHRSEHWIVVAGTAKVTVDDDVFLVTENQSVYVPLGAVHRLENPGKVDMVLIEVQTGSYLDEDDILRYDDIYART